MTKILCLIFILSTNISIAQDGIETYQAESTAATSRRIALAATGNGSRTGGIVGGALSDLIFVAAGRNELTKEGAELTEVVSTVDCKKVFETVCRVDGTTGFGESFDYMNSIMRFSMERFPASPLALPGATEFVTRDTKCQCIKEKVAEKTPFTPEELLAEEENLKKQVKTALDKKFLDDYASHFEDVRFFATNAGKIFDPNEAKQNEVAERLQCSDNTNYDKAFKDNKDKCKNVTGRKRQERIATLMQSLGNKVSGDFAHNLRQLNMQILGGAEYGALLFQSGDSFNRRKAYDRKRHAVARKSSEILLADRMLTSVLKNQAFRNKILHPTVSVERSPRHIFWNTIEEDLANGDQGLKSLFDRNVLGNELYAEMEANLNQKNKAGRDAFLEKLKISFDAAALFHPGFMNIFKSEEMLEEAAAKIGTNPSVINLLETSDIMKKHFEQECTKLANDLVEVVCSSDDELLAKTGQTDLARLILSDEDTSDKKKGIQAIIACEKGSELPRDYFRRLNLDGKYSQTSDFYDRMTRPKAEQRNLQAIMDRELSKNKDLARDVASAEKEYASESNGIPYDTVGASLFGKKSDVSRPIPARATDADFVANSQKLERTERQDRAATEYSQVESFDGQRQQGQGVNPNYSNSLNNNVISPSSEKIDARKEMRDFLNNSASKETVNSLMNDSSDDVMKNLIQLKEETEKNRLKILELTSENEKLKLQAMEDKLNALKQDRAALEPGNPVIKPSDVTKREPILQPSINRDISRDIASTQTFEAGGATAGTGPAAATSGPGSASLGGLNRALLSSSAGNLSQIVNQTAPVVVSSGAARNGSLEIKSREVGMDLLNYISSKEGDIQTLIDLKTSGILYKYKVIESGVVVEKEVLIQYDNLNDDVKKIIDTKISQNKNRANEVVRMDKEINELQRTYSYSALKIILGEQMKK